jgi:hypothetical protein
MVDLQVIEIRDVLRVVSVAAIPASNPPTVLLRGQDFNSAQLVLINEVESPEIVIVSNQEILAQMPTTQVDVPLRSVVVVSHRITNTDRSQISFTLGNAPQTMAGITMLVQQFLKLMLQAPGTDIFSQKNGGGLLRAVGRQISAPTSSTLVADLNLSVSRARQQLLTLQARNPKLSMTERLAYARVAEARFNPTELSLVGRVAIGNQASQGSVVGLGL